MKICNIYDGEEGIHIRTDKHMFIINANHGVRKHAVLPSGHYRFEGEVIMSAERLMSIFEQIISGVEKRDGYMSK